MKIKRLRAYLKRGACGSLLALCALLAHGQAQAFLPPGEPSFFAGNPSTRQLAIRHRIGLKMLGWSSNPTGIYAMYSQSSFWYLDNEDRGYTVENNFEPEIQFFADGMFLARAADWWPGVLDFSLSYSHHSNGIDGLLSRSWNHLNGGLYIGVPSEDSLCVTLTGWYPFNVEAGNLDIASYAGHGRLALYYQPGQSVPVLGHTQIYLASTFSFDSPPGGMFTLLEASLAFAPHWLARPPFPQPTSQRGDHQPETQFGFFIQWVVGRGESLIQYQSYQNTLRIGLRLW